MYTSSYASHLDYSSEMFWEMSGFLRMNSQICKWRNLYYSDEGTVTEVKVIVIIKEKKIKILISILYSS